MQPIPGPASQALSCRLPSLMGQAPPVGANATSGASPSTTASTSNPDRFVSNPQDARDVVDEVKKHSTLIGLTQPAAIVVGLASHPGHTLSDMATIASATVHGNLGQAAHDASALINQAVHPGGIAGTINGSGLGLQAAANAVVGGVEIFEGVKHKDKFLNYIGAADLLGCAANVTQLCGASLPALGLALTSTAVKVGLIVRYSHDYSRIQKAKVLFDAAGSVSSAVLRSGVAPLPGAIGNVLFGPAELLYMNNGKVRAGVDHGVDWLIRHVPHHHQPQGPTPPASTPTALQDPVAGDGLLA